MRILVVDDSRTMRLISRRCYEELGYQVCEAQNGAAALNSLAQQGPFDIVVLDWNMPVMDGLTCLQKIRQVSHYSSTKVVICTTEGHRDQVMNAIRSGADGYVLKPATKAQLHAAVAKALGVDKPPKIGGNGANGNGQQSFIESRPVEAITHALREVFHSHLKQPICLGPIEVADVGTTILSGVSGVVCFNGEVGGQLVMNFPLSVATKYTQAYLHDEDLPDGAVHETIRELAAIVLNRAAYLGEPGGDSSAEAAIIEGDGYTICPPVSARTARVPCNCTHGNFTLHISIVDDAT